jgi:hypothetical protein
MFPFCSLSTKESELSVHRKEKRWVVRWRDDDRQRSRSFPTKHEATDFDRAMRATEQRDRDRILAADLLDRATANAGDDPVELRELAAQARTFADAVERRADELEAKR